MEQILIKKNVNNTTYYIVTDSLWLIKSFSKTFNGTYGSRIHILDVFISNQTWHISGWSGSSSINVKTSYKKKTLKTYLMYLMGKKIKNLTRKMFMINISKIKKIIIIHFNNGKYVIIIVLIPISI